MDKNVIFRPLTQPSGQPTFSPGNRMRMDKNVIFRPLTQPSGKSTFPPSYQTRMEVKKA